MVCSSRQRVSNICPTSRSLCESLHPERLNRSLPEGVRAVAAIRAGLNSPAPPFLAERSARHVRADESDLLPHQEKPHWARAATVMTASSARPARAALITLQLKIHKKCRACDSRTYYKIRCVSVRRDVARQWIRFSGRPGDRGHPAQTVGISKNKNARRNPRFLPNGRPRCTEQES